MIVLMGCNPILKNPTFNSKLNPTKTSQSAAKPSGITGIKWQFLALTITPLTGGAASNFYFTPNNTTTRPYLIFSNDLKSASGFAGCFPIEGQVLSLGGDYYQIPRSAVGNFMACTTPIEDHLRTVLDAGFVIGPGAGQLILEGRVNNKDYRFTFEK